MGVSGNLEDMALTTLISVNCTEGNQARLQLQRGEEEEALIYFDEGEIVHMVLGDQRGEEVIYELLTWEHGLFELEMDVPAPERTVQASWSNLLLEGMQWIDEAGLLDGFPQEGDGAPQQELEEDIMASLQDVLMQMAEEIPGFVAADVVGLDGLSIAGL